jgi:hypothetical protein
VPASETTVAAAAGDPAASGVASAPSRTKAYDVLAIGRADWSAIRSSPSWRTSSV